MICRGTRQRNKADARAFFAKTHCALIVLSNFKSERLHQSLGFSRAGVFLKTGYKCGEWHDVCWFEKRLAPIEGPPGPVIPVSGLSEGLLSALIERRLNLYKKSG